MVVWKKNRSRRHLYMPQNGLPNAFGSPVNHWHSQTIPRSAFHLRGNVVGRAQDVNHIEVLTMTDINRVKKTWEGSWLNET